ncbi:MAG: DUF87 domain-containing protein [Candidatus Paceibacterota bacterium]
MLGEKFNSPEQERGHVQERVGERLARSGVLENGEWREQVAKEIISEYGQEPLSETHSKEYAFGHDEIERTGVRLDPEPHDAQIAELIHILEERGIKNAIAVMARLRNPHLEDDFLRFLVQYLAIHEGDKTLSKNSPEWKALHMVLYEVSLPTTTLGEQNRSLKELVSAMEQFYSGMLSIQKEGVGPAHCTIELAVENHKEEFIFYVSVPKDRSNIFENHMQSVFPQARIRQEKNDYNIFNVEGESVGAYATFAKPAVYPLKTIEAFDHDPLASLISSFEKVDHEGEGAAIQIVFHPVNDRYVSKYTHVIEDVAKGTPVKEALARPDTLTEHIFAGVKDLFAPSSTAKKEEEEEPAEKIIDTDALELFKQKVSSPIVEVNIRVIASSRTKAEAEAVLSDIESSFNQFEHTRGNKLVFTHLHGSNLRSLLRDFSFRFFYGKRALPLSLRELSSIMHFPNTGAKVSSQLRSSKSGVSSAPVGIPREGVVLGINKVRNNETPIYMTPEDRLRHLYVIGQTGTGKTSLLKNMIVQDIQNGDGVCFIDPHGSDVQDILAQIPRERFEDVIYFDPSYTARPMSLNMLEYDERYPEQKTFVVNEMLSIFNKLFDMKAAGGPMFEQYFRNAALLILDDPTTGSTLLELSRVLADKKFRELKLSRCRNPIVIQFWREVAEKAGGEASLQNMVPYITSKFDNFLSNDIMRPIIAQQKSSLNFREIMDSRKILLVNLSKGRLGESNANLIGLILVGKILMSALSRVDSLSSDIAPFYLYIDEFQNVTTDSISTILSEARKYKLSLTIAHQFINQLEDDIRDAVFGNVGSLAAFRVGSEDAEFLEKQFAPTFSAKDIMELDNYNAYVRMLASGRPIAPFNIETLPPQKGRGDIVDQVKELSYLKYGKERSIVEQEILSRYRKTSVGGQ